MSCRVLEFDEPASGVLVSERIEISGSAADANLRLYRLEVRAADEGEDWKTIIQSDAAERDEVTAQWTPPEVEGKYEIRLTAEDSSGNPPVEARVTLLVDRIPPQAEILSPIENQQLPLQVEILGTAHDRNFGEYIIEYNSEDSPDIWLPISKPAAFLNSRLEEHAGDLERPRIGGRVHAAAPGGGSSRSPHTRRSPCVSQSQFRANKGRRSRKSGRTGADYLSFQ